MIELKYSPRYLSERKKFLRNNSELLNKTIKTLSILAKNPKHPSLKLEKLKGSRVWTIRIDKGNRIFLFWVDLRTALLIDIGKHDKYRKY
ncbi:MAG: plasmid stabilization protein [Patescibacteria group bacterium]